MGIFIFLLFRFSTTLAGKIVANVHALENPY